MNVPVTIIIIVVVDSIFVNRDCDRCKVRLILEHSSQHLRFKKKCPDYISHIPWIKNHYIFGQAYKLSSYLLQVFREK